MFIHNINPVILDLGIFQLRYYNLVYILSLFVIYFTLLYASNKKLLNITKNQALDFSVYLMMGVVIGARLFEVIFWEPLYYLSNPLKIFYLWEGGMSLHGGILGMVVVSYFYCKKHKINLAKFADIICIPGTLMLGFGRIANFINGEIVGTITNIWWCVKFPLYEGCRHPVQIYGALGRFLLFGQLLWMYKKKHNDGFIFWSFIMLSGAGRFVIDFLREDPRLFGLSEGQYLSLIMLIMGLFILIKYYRNNLIYLIWQKRARESIL